MVTVIIERFDIGLVAKKSLGKKCITFGQRICNDFVKPMGCLGKHCGPDTIIVMPYGFHPEDDVLSEQNERRDD